MYIFNIRKINIYIYICEIQITLFIHYRNVNIINFKFAKSKSHYRNVNM